MKKESQVIFDRNVAEFVTVAAEFCNYLEQAETIKRATFVDTTLKILPLLYLKAAMLPECHTIGEELPGKVRDRGNLRSVAHEPCRHIS